VKKKLFLYVASATIVLTVIFGLVALLKFHTSKKDHTSNPPPPLETNITAVSGLVISGGNTTPEGLSDAPRNFVYAVKEEGGSLVNVSYTAYPPSTAGNDQKAILDFEEGIVNIGNYIEARGRFNKESNTVVVGHEGDYLKSFAEKPIN